MEAALRHFALFALMTVATAPAVAQPSLSTYAQLGPFYGNTILLRAGSTSDRLICMRQIRTGKRVCHTRDGWRLVAARLARSEGTR